jgi:hypothetical protein
MINIRGFLPNGKYRQRTTTVEMPNGSTIKVLGPTEDELLQIRHMLLEEVKRQNEEGNAI